MNVPFNTGLEAGFARRKPADRRPGTLPGFQT